MNMGIVRVFICLTIMTGLCACGGGGNSNSSNNGTISNFTAGQNGTSSSPWGDGSSSHRPAMAVKFTPTTYPVTITSVTVYARNTTGSDSMFNLYGYSDLATETEFFSSVQNQSIPDSGTSYSIKTVSIPPTTISSGSFYIAVEWVTKPLSSVSGANSFFLRTDSQLDYTNTNFVRYTGKNWSSLESVSASSGDLGIFVGYGSNASNDKPVVVSTNPPNGAIGVGRNVQEIEIQFNKEMTSGYSVTGGINWPLSSSTLTEWAVDRRIFHISRDNAASPLPAGTQISLTINGAGHSFSFRDIFGNTLDSYTVTFTTGQ